MKPFCTRAARPALRLTMLAGLMLGQAAFSVTAMAAAPLKNARPAASAPAALAAPLPALLNLAEGKSTLLPLPFAAARVAVGEARIADVILINPSEVYLLGKAVGTTNLIVWNKAGQPHIVDLAVGFDTPSLKAQLDQLFPGEKGLRVSAAAGAVVLSGVVSDTVKASQITAFASAHLQRGGAAAAAPAAASPAAASGSATTMPTSLAAIAPAADSAAAKVINMMSIAAPQQVMLEVKIAEVSKTLVDQLGARLNLSAKSGAWGAGLLSDLLSGNSSALTVTRLKNGNTISIDAEKRDGLVKVLAEPNIMAISGQEASFLAGGKIFIPVAQDSSGGTNKITLEEREYGIAVKFTPTVLEGGRINLKVAPEVSELNREGIGISTSSGSSSASAILPAFTTRRATTTVQLFDGQSFAIGGLIKNNVTTNIKALPMLGEIPVLGALFRSSDFQTDRTELVFIITPHLVQPLDSAEMRLPTDAYVEPSRAEFFLNGKMEGAPAPQGNSQNNQGERK